jgi:thiosulfate/3-mercaptopyruvate sulfurtransferase
MKRLVSYLAPLGLWCVVNSAAAAVQLPGPLVEPGWLAAHLDEVVVLDVRKDVKSFTAKARLAKDKKTGKLSIVAVGGHIPGAGLVDYKKVRATRVINGRKVSGVVPAAADFQALMQAAGVNKGDTVVVTSKGMNALDMTMATRLYWQIKYFGDDQVALLNGGMAQWILEGRPLTTSSPVKPGNWVAGAPRSDLVATSDDVSAALDKGSMQLVDNRALQQYIGVSKKSSVKAKGHIPGAKSFPFELLLRGTPSRFVAIDELKQLNSAMGVKANQPSINYCNTGHLASGGWFVLHELLGNKQAKLYDGSMLEWTLEKQPVKAMVME